MIDLQQFVDSLGPINISKDDAAVAIAAICAQSRLDERERCAKIADSHKGSAARKRRERGQKLSNFGLDNSDEIQCEERGEDIAAEMIAAAIRQS